MAEPSGSVRESEMESKAESSRNQEDSASCQRRELTVQIPAAQPEAEAEAEEGPAPPPRELLHATSVPGLAKQIGLAEEGRSVHALQEHVKQRLAKARTAPAAALEAAMEDLRPSRLQGSPIPLPLLVQPSAPSTPVQVPDIAWPSGKKPPPIRLKPEPSPKASPDPSPPPSPKRRMREALMGKLQAGQREPDAELPKLEDHVAVS